MSGNPSIRISHPLQHQQHQQQPTQSPPRDPTPPSVVASPMAIPKAREHIFPPPLPPPTTLSDMAAGHDPGWQWGNDGSDFGRPSSLKHGSSLLGGGSRLRDYRLEKEHEYPPHHASEEFLRRGSSLSTITGVRDRDMSDGRLTPSDDGGSITRPLSNHRLQGERQLEQRTLEHSSNSYDKHLLSRIGGPNGHTTPKRGSQTSVSMQETAQLAHAESERWSGQLRPLTMHDRRQSGMSSPGSSRWPSSGTLSPGFQGFFDHVHPENSRNNSLHSLQWQSRNASLTFDDSMSQRGSYDISMHQHDDSTDDGPMSHLNLQDRSPGSEDLRGARTGDKRRASSPPRDPSRDDRMSVGNSSAGGILHRRSIHQGLGRDGPSSRYNSSISSASSFGPRNGSLGSSLEMGSITSNATSYGSGRVSPSSTLSPAFDPEFRSALQYSVKTSNIETNSAMNPPSRHVSESVASPHTIGPSAPQSRRSSITQLNGAHMCECCPKKPKKFDTLEGLRLHESEKQYTCAYCPNRFKNKNEAERHQNSLHLRRHSWSCAALTSAHRAFHPSTASTSSPSSGSSATDVCGYCGDEFPNPPNWDARTEHLNAVHKFGECNLGKKFFRADHFRQHLKHSHQGTSGKWTNLLEVACMKDEPMPEKRSVGGGLVVETGGLGEGRGAESAT
ncbi:C2H2 finger domain protein [Zymoseptoria brevis]|uniref:C2H2 finger domain protein n=1 Tax=Zymoseptoria brevis TaxID=1047168 RepID=A0A0F4GJE7_9PEZI|nr:C2H2 finger domain protein [Zymoseptoria brevis]